MKKFFSIFLLFICVNFCLNSSNKSVNAFSINTSSKIVMEVSTGRILYEDNAFEQKYMASTTKILTAITIIENCNLDEVITVTSKSVGIEGSSIYLEEGEKLTVKDLLYGLMLRSGNDCAVTLALHCRENINEFADLMNATAERIGAENSNFTNPHGLHDDNHYTTAYDLAKISCYAMKNDIFREIVGTKTVKIPFTTREYDRYLVNKNKMLKEFPDSTGIKTGYTKKAGRCLVSSCKRDGMELVCVVLNLPPMFEESKQLLTNAFNNYKLYKLYESDEIIDFIPISNSNKSCGVYVKEDIYFPLSNEEVNQTNVVFNIPDQLCLPIEKDKEIGEIQVFVQKRLLFCKKIYTINKID